MITTGIQVKNSSGAVILDSSTYAVFYLGSHYFGQSASAQSKTLPEYVSTGMGATVTVVKADSSTKNVPKVTATNTDNRVVLNVEANGSACTVNVFALG